MGRFSIAFVWLLVGVLIFWTSINGQLGSLLAVIFDPGDMTIKGAGAKNG